MYSIPAGLIAKILAEKYGKPFVVTLHGSDVNILMPHRKEIYVDVFEKASATIFVSRALLERAKSMGFSGKNAVVIANGYDEAIFKPVNKKAVRKELGIHREGYRYVGFVGNLIPIKRADKLGEIFRLIAKEIPEMFFIIVGDGPLRKKIEKETKGLNIIFTGRLPQKDVAKYMNAMDVMMLPSREEGFGAVVIEAQACGTCVIGSSNGGIPEAIGFDEYVVEEGENFEERFAKRVVDVLKSGYNRNKLIERAKGFTWEEIVRREIEIYERAKRP
jgi:glycosyltransferase involved in cell wall biosynthesis